MDFVDPTSTLMLKLLLAAFLGVIVGTERALMANQAAGSRTFGLVSLGSCLFVLTGMSVDSQFIGLVNFDPARVLASVVQGIGFLGAGLIIFKGDSLHGVTTAAGLWVAAAVGAVVAFGMYQIAIFSTLLTLAIFFGMWYVENTFKHWFIEVKERGDSRSL
ncbi:MAG: putative Mg2+ transporter-C (MgtC) family protein [Parcubacteria group bacterium Gr01-1014_8]|nr:MAG: putative Mg2+ transporter-C (MgtC) family protein [Parcubacteria group bacterium Gr01-1014_8]